MKSKLHMQSFMIVDQRVLELQVLTYTYTDLRINTCIKINKENKSENYFKKEQFVVWKKFRGSGRKIEV